MHIIRIDDISSTNDLALKLGQEGIPDETVIIACHQTKGRGRWERKWVSPPGKGIYASYIFKGILLKKAHKISFIVAAAVCRALKSIIFIKVRWPNDLIYAGKKIGGILSETVPLGRKNHILAVVGLGLNITTQKNQLPAGATSLLLATKKEYNKDEIIAKINYNVSYLYKKLKVSDVKIDKLLNGFFETKNKMVKIKTGSQREKSVYALGINEDGALLIKSGKKGAGTQKIYSGDIIYLRENNEK